MSQEGTPGENGSSAFWLRLGREHASALAEHGFRAIKRRQALRYFTWRWDPRRMIRSEQFRFLVLRTTPSLWFRAALERMDLSDTSWHEVNWSVAERWTYSFATRLLWEYARVRDSIGASALPEPELGAPLPTTWRRRLISQDLANSSLETNAITRGVESPPRSILEIGAGYGRTAYVLLSIFPMCSYTIVDVEPALSISRWYLTQLFPTARLRFIAPSDVNALPDAYCDLALSISSLQEMTPEQIGTYLRLLDRVAAPGLVYLKQWTRWHNPVDDVTTEFDLYPIPERWSLLYRESAPVQTRFTQALWRVPG
jgi:putative sugar O-methyltransferase